MRICTFVVALALTAVAGVGQARPVTFDLDGPGSSIDYRTQFGGCGDMYDPEPCISVDTVAGLGATMFTLDNVGDSYTFDFAQVMFDSTVGGELGDLEATIAFDSPSGASASTAGEGEVINLFGFLQLGSLVWLPIPDVTLPNGIAFGIELAELNGINLGGSVTVDATLTLLATAVPEPMAFVLIGLGLLALGAIRARRIPAP